MFKKYGREDLEAKDEVRNNRGHIIDLQRPLYVILVVRGIVMKMDDQNSLLLRI